MFINTFYFLPYMGHKFLRINTQLQKRWLLVIIVLYVCLMIFGAVYPRPQDIPVFSGHTKYFHFFGFAVLAILLLKLFELYKFKHKTLLTAIIIIFFAIFTETMQLIVPNRDFAYTDMLIDTVGGILGWGLYKWIFYKV